VGPPSERGALDEHDLDPGVGRCRRPLRTHDQAPADQVGHIIGHTAFAPVVGHLLLAQRVRPAPNRLRDRRRRRDIRAAHLQLDVPPRLDLAHSARDDREQPVEDVLDREARHAQDDLAHQCRITAIQM
jgi:hypothetical protein